MCFALHPAAFVDIPILLYESTNAVWNIVPPLTCVAISIRPLLLSPSILDVFKPLSFVNDSALRALNRRSHLPQLALLLVHVICLHDLLLLLRLVHNQKPFTFERSFWFSQIRHVFPICEDPLILFLELVPINLVKFSVFNLVLLTLLYNLICFVAKALQDVKSLFGRQL
jgi:hypothetical protein